MEIEKSGRKADWKADWKAGQKKIAIYSRKSKFTGKGESIENQIELCRQYIKLHYGEAALEGLLIFEDEGFSGGNLDRPQFKKMMKEAKKEKISSIICYRLDRISRNIGDFASLIEELNDIGVSFISIKEQFDTTSPMGRAMMYIASVFSQLERETIAERIRDNMHELAKDGRWLGGVTPTGYESENLKSVTVDGKQRQSCKLKIIEEEAKLISLIYKKFLETKSLAEVDRFLWERGYETKNQRKFSRVTIKGILNNPVYMIADEDAFEYFTAHKADLFSEKEEFDGKHGIMTYNKTIQKRGKSHIVRPIEEWIVSVGKHEGIIPGREWIKVQEILGKNASKSRRKPRSHTALLSGVLYCGCCGSYMRPKLSKRLNEDNEQIYTYLCSLKEQTASKKCAMPVINGNMLDKIIINEIKSFESSPKELLRKLEEGKGRMKDSIREEQGELKAIEEKVREKEKKIDSLTKILSEASDQTRPYILKEIESLHQQKEQLLCRQLDFGKGEETGFPYSFKEAVELMSLEEKREAVGQLIDRVVWDGKDISIYFLNTWKKEGA